LRITLRIKFHQKWRSRLRRIRRRRRRIDLQIVAIIFFIKMSKETTDIKCLFGYYNENSISMIIIDF